jgi:DNA-binding helix-hairpin-helix protein with protein kinase domain
MILEEGLYKPFSTKRKMYIFLFIFWRKNAFFSARLKPYIDWILPILGKMHPVSMMFSRQDNRLRVPEPEFHLAFQKAYFEQLLLHVDKPEMHSDQT